MTPTLLTIVLAAFLSGDPPTSDDPPPRKPNPLAPSLPQLTSEEEDRLDNIIDRFMLFDTGQLKGEEGKKARDDFDRLGPEAIPALIRGINRAAVMENSCPTLVIAKKLAKMLIASDDAELLDFAHDNIGAGIGHSMHMAVLQDLRTGCMIRRNALLRLAERTGVKPPRQMTTAELADAMARDSGNRLKMELMELGQRKGPDAMNGLIAAAGAKDEDVRKMAFGLMVSQMSTQGIEVVQKELADEHSDARRAAARAAAKFTSLVGDLIPLLSDADADVAAAAHQSLVKISGGQDFGPTSMTKTEIDAARKKWQAWWDKEHGQ
ncbi:MAG TPA: hypothetical protein VMS17_01560 [Gemmataceae bacterium]|nr:hypothetical protein [Gemmataceae bacterium]